MATTVDLILKGFVITMNKQFDLFPDGAVAVSGDSIVAVGPAAQLLEAYTAPEIIDCAGKVIMPGLVNAHTHVPMTLLRGLNDDLRLDVWLGYLMPLEREFVTPEFVRLGTQLACAEMIRAGVTSFADMYYFEDSVAAATADAGLRALLGQTILTFPSPDAESYEDGIVLCRHFIEAWLGHPLITPAVAPHAWYTGTPDMLRACADLARAYDVPLHTHVSETAIEVENCREQTNGPVVPWINKHGLLDTKLIAAHCVHIDRGEMIKLRKAGAGIAHCPSSNLKLASGFAPIGKMLELDLNVGVGTDGPASNNDLDMFEEMRLAALLAKAVDNDPTTLPARTALEVATIRGARAIHLDHLTGSLEPGKRADLIVVNQDTTHNWPHFHNNPEAVYSRLVYAAKSTDVDDVLCNGRWLMRERQLLTVDEQAARSAAREVAAQIDAFVHERESSPYNKLVALAGVQRMESYEVQIKIELSAVGDIVARLDGGDFEVAKQAYYRQYDHYMLFDGQDPDAARLRFREDSFLNENQEVTHARSRLTLIGEIRREEMPNTVMLSRSRYLAPAQQSLRFYQEYFDPAREIAIQKLRRRWRVIYQDTDMAINIDQITVPALPGYFLEVKSRTWSRHDAKRKAELITALLEELGVNVSAAERKEYVEIAMADA